MAGLSLESGLGDVNEDVGSRDIQVFDWGHEVRQRSARLGSADAQTLEIESGIRMSTRLGENFSRMQTCTKRSIGDTGRWDVGLDGKFSHRSSAEFLHTIRTTTGIILWVLLVSSCLVVVPLYDRNDEITVFTDDQGCQREKDAFLLLKVMSDGPPQDANESLTKLTACAYEHHHRP
ncbi:hypothetical protein ARMSODRAFT_1006966 [Armillaria solidipes]|uniref:Uncharacterized protein n=1 Tax=Armillaria solidipes TaxID=1076256 RepID=A0A2H3B6X2_9AGAR|nr:hypothetical protein ARMSODRAFT_1006966 [Armillaria solidipes]